MIFLLRHKPPTENGYYWALIPPKSFLGKEEPAKWEPVEIDGKTIWIMGDDVPAQWDWVEDWKWGPRIYPPLKPSNSTGEKETT